MIAGGGLMALPGCQRPRPRGPLTGGSHPDLAAHSEEFTREVITVAEGVHVAIGFGLANSILIEGTDGVIIIDTMESHEAALPVKEAFSRIIEKPVKAIIYTHYHPDHTFGARVFWSDDRPEIYSHERTLAELDRIINVVRPITYTRAVRQFGTLLPEGWLINAGIGPYLLFDNDTTTDLMLPTKTFGDDLFELEVAGVRMELVYAPGETPDQIFVWLPERKILFCADNFYKSFPNLYAIRGTPYRDVTQWVSSLDTMRERSPEYLVPCHTRPILGREAIDEVLTNYRDAIQFVHDQTVRGINEGLTPDELVERVTLPPHLKDLPYLHEYYGTVEWSVRAIFNGYLGWFDGNAGTLFPLSPRERAQRLSNIMGGNDGLLKIAREALEASDFQWAVELTGLLCSLDPDHEEARSIRASALVALGEQQIAATARNYYLTQALETEGAVTIGERTVKEVEVVHQIPLSAIFTAMAVSLDAERSSDIDRVVLFRFPDVDEVFTVHVRRGVAEIQNRRTETPDITVTVSSTVWKEIVAGLRNPAAALAAGTIKIDGGTFDLVRFLGLFKTG
jgi:alkyl sulfatase BDS1-like metallo-beta-lactamase superfamily hydrolase